MQKDSKSKTYEPLRLKKKATSTSVLPSVIFSSKLDFIPELSGKSHLFTFLLYSGTSLNAMIPTSFISMKMMHREALYYYSQGELHVEIEENSLDHFFDLTRENEPKKYRQPKYIHFTKESVYLHADEQEARDMLKVVVSEFNLIQKYIASCTKFSKKVRALWNAEKGFSFALVSNKNLLPKTQWFAKETSQKRTNSSYLHSLAKYSYAGRLLKSSFSPFNLYSSRLKKTDSASSSKSLVNDTVYYNRQQSINAHGYNPSVYLCKQSDSVNSITVPVMIQYNHLEAIAKQFLKLVETWSDRVNGSNITDACFDFIEDSSGRWYLIGCKLQDLKLDLLVQSISLRRFMRTHTYKTIENQRKASMIQIEENVLKRKLEELHKRIESINFNSIDVSTSTHFDVKIYKDYANSITPNTTTRKSLARDNQLSPLAKLYDKTISTAIDRKREAKVQAELLAEYQRKKSFNINKIINEITSGLIASESFKNLKNPQKLAAFKEFLDDLLQGKAPLSKQQTIQQIKDLGMSKRTFPEYLLTINNALDSEYNEQHKDMIMFRLIDFSGLNTFINTQNPD